MFNLLSSQFQTATLFGIGEAFPLTLSLSCARLLFYRPFRWRRSKAAFAAYPHSLRSLRYSTVCLTACLAGIPGVARLRKAVASQLRSRISPVYTGNRSSGLLQASVLHVGFRPHTTSPHQKAVGGGFNPLTNRKKCCKIKKNNLVQGLRKVLV